MDMRVELNQLACMGLEAHRGGIPAGVRAALFHYAGKLTAGRRLRPYPPFLVGKESPPPHLVLDLEIEPELERLLEREAQASNVTVNQIVGHSILVYLAENEFLSTASS